MLSYVQFKGKSDEVGIWIGKNYVLNNWYIVICTHEHTNIHVFIYRWIEIKIYIYISMYR